MHTPSRQQAIELDITGLFSAKFCLNTEASKAQRAAKYACAKPAATEAVNASAG
jgi:hypothetical protein